MDDKIVVKYYCPLSVSLLSKHASYGWENEAEDIDSQTAALYDYEISKALDSYDDGNMHEYFDEPVAKKLKSVVWGVEVVNRTLYGCITVELNDFLTKEEEDELKDEIEGQNSDGFGEGFEQRGIEVEDGELYVGFWHRGDDYFILNQGEFMKRLGKKQPYGFSYRETEKCRNYWWNLQPGDRIVAAALELMCMSIELNLEMSADGKKSANFFVCKNFENTGWDSDDYAVLDVETVLSDLTSWEQVEDFMYNSLMDYCKDNEIDYTRLTLEDDREVNANEGENTEETGLTVSWLIDMLKKASNGEELPIEFQSYEWNDDLEDLSYHERCFEKVYKENGKIVIQISR